MKNGRDLETMCGRFVGFRNLEQLREAFPIEKANCHTAASFNVAPGQEILAIVRQNEVNILDCFHWGLVPFWSRDSSIGNKLINARCETAAVKASFREAFKSRRCLIPADGFYEWKTLRGEKQPFFITLPDKKPFAFAGLWENWQDRRNPGQVYRSCTILTRESSDCVRVIHPRMPAILSPQVYTAWLDPENKDRAELQKVLRDHTLTDFTFHPVSKQVNTTRGAGSDPAFIQPIQLEFEF